jgi:hypothetical protein
VGALHGMHWLLSPGGREVAPTGHLTPFHQYQHITT